MPHNVHIAKAWRIPPIACIVLVELNWIFDKKRTSKQERQALLSAWSRTNGHLESLAVSAERKAKREGGTRAPFAGCPSPTAVFKTIGIRIFKYSFCENVLRDSSF